MSTTFGSAVWQLILGNGQLPDGFGGSKVLVFAVGCVVMGLLIVIFDLIIFAIEKKSVLGLIYNGFWRTVGTGLIWAVGAGVGGFLGASVDIFHLTRGACMAVGVGWSLILPRLIELFGPKEDEQSPEEE